MAGSNVLPAYYLLPVLLPAFTIIWRIATWLNANDYC